LSEELDEARNFLDESLRRFNRETKELEAKVKAETERNSKLHEAFENLRNKCADFATWGANRLKGIFNCVGAASEEINPSAENIPGAFDHIENEVEALDEVITGHGDFCALVASRGTTAAFMKARFTHTKTINEMLGAFIFRRSSKT
jgi:selenocysteine lyase/cysteine desulfurase